MLHIRGRALPDGEPIDLYADGDRWRTDPAPGADLVATGWILPGLVDAHTHPGTDNPADGLDDELLREHLTRHVDAGVTLIRAPGLAGEPPAWFGTDPDLPRAVHAGPWMARHGAFFDGAGLTVDPTDMPAIAAAQAARTGWVKLIGDWPDTAPLPVDVLTAIVAAAHTAGGRVAMHCQHADSCRAAVTARIDTIEHGQHLDPALLDTMAAQGTVWVPTLAVFTDGIARQQARPATARRDAWLTGTATMGPNTAAAAEAGVTLLAGTDSRPHGRIAGEIRALTTAGVPVHDALGAASWTARTYLGLPGLTDGAPADAVVYDSDPRLDLRVLDHPRRVILRGRVVR